MELRAGLEKVAQDVAHFLREVRDDSLDVVIKKHGTDYTKKVDELAEARVFEGLEREGFHFDVVSEESGRTVRGSDYVVVVDPLDGSTNYLSGIPWCSVSLALFHKGGRLLDSFAGAVAEIYRDVVYSYDEEGSYVNGVRTSRKRPQEVVIGYFNSSQWEQAKRILDDFPGAKVRSLGSASLDMINVCLGSSRAYFDLRGRLRNVDVAASLGFCLRLGLRPTSFDGSPLEVDVDDVRQIQSIVLRG
ncbi:extragenic suppressor protein suhB [Sulfodiicoccus acidiphilus]|uniref:Extragenic suppressor protein suhB n=1 Tax=Sulfodiicoccus acidiphilus TaxID=1670455 RepID=A0A348B494_9CREN|nr:inositol monophosphatase family protein [Sulfodiicoccus acidiphilus]BBD72996.1 extragenic suppressor protein suhB [Sulfodiicoccus acidiphilus]GGT87485.1 extragenic suppressor protein suhB [Sulfodiicoccus acidiphilus]